MNPLLSMFSGNGFTQIMMQAVGAAMRGESPEAFMKKLAKNNPQLKGIDLDNLEESAHKLAKQKGIDENALIENVKSSVNKFM